MALSVVAAMAVEYAIVPVIKRRVADDVQAAVLQFCEKLVVLLLGGWRGGMGRGEG